MQDTGGSNRIPPDERRAQIIECATTLFATKGFIRTTMDDVAEAANITKRTLYRYFTSKDELLHEIHDQFTRDGLVPSTAAPTRDAAEELAAIIRRHIELALTHRTAINVFFEERKHLTGQRWRRIEERRDAYEMSVVQVVRAGSSQGRFRELEPRPVAQAILGGLTEFYRWMHPEGRLTAEELIEAHVRLFLDGAAVDREITLTAPDQPPSLPTRRREAANGRHRVREAAIASFARMGFHGTSMRDLARAANLTKGAVMYHTRYKQDLLEEIHRVTFESNLEVLEKTAAAATGGPVNTLYQLITAHMDFMSEHRDAIAVVNENMRYLEPESFARIDVLRRRWNQVFRSVIEEGVSSGALQPFDPWMLTMTVVGMLNSAARWYNPEGAIRPERIAEIYARVLLLGLLAP